MDKDRIIRLPEVLERTGLSRTTIWRQGKAGYLPAKGADRAARRGLAGLGSRGVAP